MSDGPHKSLPLRQHWKEVMRRASNMSYQLGDVQDALTLSLKREFREMPLGAVRAVLCGEKQASLFRNDCSVELEGLRGRCRGSAIGNAIIDCAIEANANGLTGETALHFALSTGLKEYAQSGCYQIEEHQYRIAPEDAARVCSRLRAALATCSYDSIATDLLSGPPSKGSLRLPKQTGIDDGPRL